MKPSVRKILLNSAAPYSGAQLVLDFVGSRSNGQPYYMLNGAVYPRVDRVPGWTYTGGASTGCYAARLDGSLQFFPQNVPRITDAGYWAEEARTNLLLQSQTFGTTWTTAGTSVTANQIAAPDGTLTAEKLDELTNTGGHQIYQPVTVSTSTVYTYSVYLKAAERSFAAVYDGTAGKGKFFNLSTGAILGNLIAAPDNATITSAGNGWWRCTITITTASTGSSPAVYISTDGSTFSYTGTAGSGIYIWQADLQAGSFATSPIPTTSVAVTRAADVGYLPLTGPTDGTMFVEGSVQNMGASPLMLGHNSANTTGLYVVSTLGNHWNGTASIGNTGTVAAFPSITRMALAYTGTSSRSLSVNASAVTTSATSVGTINRIAVGTAANLVTPAQSAQAPIRRVVIYPRAFANSELQAITTAGAY